MLIRRRFSKRERWAVWLAQDGRSAKSGELLGVDFHADHRVPWSKGGHTSIENCDVLTPTENLAKGAKMKSRFEWQDQFVRAWQSWPGPNFFLCALPGAGKTRGARRIARLWVDEGCVVVVVGPTNPIKRNWRTEFQRDGLMLDANFYGALRAGYHGVVTNYQAVKGQSLAFRKLCSDRPVLLICDEIHHASEGDTSSWGKDLREAFELAEKRLLLSGTPVRSDRETTSFLTIEPYFDDNDEEKHRYKMHFQYDWPRALEERVVRTLVFPRVKMDSVKVEFPVKGLQTFTNDEDQYLTYALDDRPFALSLLRGANDKLTELRKSDTSAGGLVVAKNVKHADIMVELLRTIGETPVIVTSKEDEDSVDVIEEFRASTKRWLVSVRQVSEGVDIPRLRVLAYLTNYVTDLAFRQLVGRVARRQENETDDSAHGFVFIPESSNLVKLAEAIERMQELVFRNEGISCDGVCGGDEASAIRQIMESFLVTEVSATLMLPHFKVSTTETTKTEEPIWVQEKLLRDECNDLAKKLANLRNRGERYPNNDVYGRVMGRIHAEFMIDNTDQPRLDISQLQRKRERLRNAIVQAQRTDR
jgi:superfamily II DNA or RNA helicase